MIRAALFALGLVTAAPAAAITCQNISYADLRYTVCQANMAQDNLRLFLNDATGTPFGQFDAIDAALKMQGESLSFAMNAGMYHQDRSPVGYYVQDGVEQMRVIPNAGPGNFGLLPNGIFCIRPDRADVFETLDFVETQPNCTYATQSGPMLVIDGELHPRFLADGTSRYVRNGVGTSQDGQTVVFAISRDVVTFHEFGSLFRDGLNMPNALYFDGNVSRLYAPDFGHRESGFRLGPIVGVVVPD